MKVFPLTKQNRITVARTFAQVDKVDISIDCVLEDQMGVVYVDSVESPQIFMIEQDQFFVYFAGNLSSESGQDLLAGISDGRMLMSGSHGWHDTLKTFYGERLVPISRWRYNSSQLSIDNLKSLMQGETNQAQIKQISVDIANTDYPYLEIGAYDSVEDFVQRGIGFCMMQDDKIVAVAYSSLVCSRAIEISIFVEDIYRRQGVATALSCQLLIWCLERGIDPHWDAANSESCILAEKLGYIEKSEYRAYFLKSAS